MELESKPVSLTKVNKPNSVLHKALALVKIIQKIIKKDY